jgi:opacity protein-like surface antigen
MQSATMSNSSDLLGNYKTDVTSYFSKRDIGFSLGLGIHFQPSDHLGLQFGFRGIYGRQNINLLTPATKVTTSALGLQIGAEYRF